MTTIINLKITDLRSFLNEIYEEHGVMLNNIVADEIDSNYTWGDSTLSIIRKNDIIEILSRRINDKRILEKIIEKTEYVDGFEINL